MTQLIILFGVLIFVAGLVLLIRPQLILGMMETNGEKTWLYLSAIGVRVVLGVILIQQAAFSKFPMLIEALGWIALIAAFAFMALGRQRFTRLMVWIIEKMKPYARVGGSFALIFGAFLVYAFV